MFQNKNLFVENRKKIRRGPVGKVKILKFRFANLHFLKRFFVPIFIHFSNFSLHFFIFFIHFLIFLIHFFIFFIFLTFLVCSLFNLVRSNEIHFKATFYNKRIISRQKVAVSFFF